VLKNLSRLFQKSTLSKIIYPLLLVLLCGVIAFKNYTPDTFLTGWDTLHPEFNYKIYWERILKGVWQDHQGLGAVATQAHASEIPRILLLMILDIFLATNQIRYAYTFLMLLLGPLGVYFLLKYLFRSRHAKWAESASFLGALVYLLNLGVTQQFIVPLEMFLTHFGFLGWFYLSFFWCLKTSNRKKDLLIFTLVNLLMVPQAHTPTLFYAHFMTFGFFVFLYLLFNLRSNFLEKLKTTGTLLAITLITNLFWLLPNIYFGLNHAEEVRDAKITRLFSQEAFLHNKQYGTLKDVAIMKNFLFNWSVYTGNDEFEPLLKVWHTHLYNPLVQIIGYVVFGLVVLGILISWIKRDKVFMALSGIFFLSLFFLFNVNPPLGFLFKLFQKHIPLFGEAFRFPFTKFSILAVFTYGIFASYALLQLFNLVAHLIGGEWGPKIISFVLTGISTALLILYALPFFKGYLISPYMRVNIPQRYFEMFDYFDSQEDYGRVVHLPIHTFWGWVYNDWDAFSHAGYQGAGFLWFGIKQPLLDREFDRWGMYNEQFYREMSHAVYSENVTELESVLEKYKIKWLLLDRSVFYPGNPESLMFYDEIETLFEKSSKTRIAKDFGAGLKVYEVDNYYEQKETKLDFYAFSDDIYGKYTDPMFLRYGEYVNQGDINFPFVNMIGRDELIDEGFITSDGISFHLKSPVPINFTESDGFTFRLNLSKEGDDLLIRLKDTSGVIAPTVTELREPNISFNSGLILSFNEDVFVSADLLTDEWKDFGLVRISLGEELAVDFYQIDSSAERGEFDYSSFGACREPRYHSSYAVDRFKDGFKLSSRRTVACVTAGLTELVDLSDSSSFLVRVRADVTSENALLQTCLFDESLGLCANKIPSEGENVALFKDTKQKNIYIRFLNYPLLGAQNTSSTIKGAEIGVAYFVKRISLTPEITVSVFEEVTMPEEYVFSGKEDFSTNDFRICDVGSRDITSGKVVFESDYLVYSTDGDDICDSIQLPAVSHDRGYILGIEARNISGIPLRLCLTNEYSKRCDLYVSLSDSNEFTKHYFLIPPMGKGFGYTINLRNLVFGDTDSENHLRRVSFTPVPYRAFNSVYVEKPSDLKVSDRTLVVYNESSEPGWLAFCGLRPCSAEHVKVNNWSNGWVFDDPVLLENVTVVFWPQILEYLGFSFLFGLFVVLFKCVGDSKIPTES